MGRISELPSKKAWAKGRNIPQVDTRYGHVCNCGGHREPDFSWLEFQQPRISVLNSAMGYVGHLPKINPPTPMIQRIIKPEMIITDEELNQRIWNEIISNIRNHAAKTLEESRYEEALDQHSKNGN